MKHNEEFSFFVVVAAKQCASNNNGFAVAESMAWTMMLEMSAQKRHVTLHSIERIFRSHQCNEQCVLADQVQWQTTIKRSAPMTRKWIVIRLPLFSTDIVICELRLRRLFRESPSLSLKTCNFSIFYASKRFQSLKTWTLGWKYNQRIFGMKRAAEVFFPGIKISIEWGQTWEWFQELFSAQFHPTLKMNILTTRIKKRIIG